MMSVIYKKILPDFSLNNNYTFKGLVDSIADDLLKNTNFNKEELCAVDIIKNDMFNHNNEVIYNLCQKADIKYIDEIIKNKDIKKQWIKISQYMKNFNNIIIELQKNNVNDFDIIQKSLNLKNKPQILKSSFINKWKSINGS
jgi:hypothetical protein